MDTAALKRIVETLVPGALLQCVHFGRMGEGCAWIETSKLQSVAAALKAQSDLSLDWLENLSAMQMDDVIVLSYFLRSRENDRAAILRSSVSLKDPEAEVSFPSLRDVWPTAEWQEEEIGRLFGVSFTPEIHRNRAKKNREGFPLRKGFAIQMVIDTPTVGGVD